jgi:hypothetical protein
LGWALLDFEYRWFNEKGGAGLDIPRTTGSTSTLHPDRERVRDTELQHLLDVWDIGALAKIISIGQPGDKVRHLPCR